GIAGRGCSELGTAVVPGILVFGRGSLCALCRGDAALVIKQRGRQRSPLDISGAASVFAGFRDECGDRCAPGNIPTESRAVGSGGGSVRDGTGDTGLDTRVLLCRVSEPGIRNSPIFGGFWG